MCRRIFCGASQVIKHIIRVPESEAARFASESGVVRHLVVQGDDRNFRRPSALCWRSVRGLVCRRSFCGASQVNKHIIRVPESEAARFASGTRPGPRYFERGLARLF